MHHCVTVSVQPQQREMKDAKVSLYLQLQLYSTVCSYASPKGLLTPLQILRCHRRPVSLDTARAKTKVHPSRLLLKHVSLNVLLNVLLLLSTGCRLSSTLQVQIMQLFTAPRWEAANHCTASSGANPRVLE